MPKYMGAGWLEPLIKTRTNKYKRALCSDMDMIGFAKLESKFYGVSS